MVWMNWKDLFGCALPNLSQHVNPDDRSLLYDNHAWSVRPLTALSVTILRPHAVDHQLIAWSVGARIWLWSGRQSAVNALSGLHLVIRCQCRGPSLKLCPEVLVSVCSVRREVMQLVGQVTVVKLVWVWCPACDCVSR
jgi:hypothetical protein